MVGPLLHAFDGPTSYVLNFPLQPNLATPTWLGQPITPTATFAKLDLPIIPVDAQSQLLVTVYFQEKEGGFLRITWTGPDGAHLLSDNFYEGISMDNQRSLLVPAAMLQDKGTLTFQCGDTTLGIQRIKLEWLESKTSLVSPEVEDLLVTPATQPTQLARNLDGWPQPAGEGAWRDKIVTVPVTDQPQRIEQGVEFSIQLDSVPNSGRLSLKEAGLPWGKRLIVWINQQRAGTITPGVPTLEDQGYSPASGDAYVGWREGSLFLPAAKLRVGVNTVQFSTEDDGDAVPPGTTSTDPNTLPPLAVKGVVLQFDYPPAVPTNANPPPTPTSSDSTGPVESDSSSSTPSGLGMP
jgi:hypothetical protein